MVLPIRTLPILERWDCHGCGVCCLGVIVRLEGAELQKIRRQGWDKHPDFRGINVLERDGWLKRRYRLAHRSDGRCVFLTAEGRCRIHQEHGASAKPLLCRMYPLQLVPLEGFAYLTLRRNCPSAAADRGRKLEEHLGEARRLAEEGRMLSGVHRPPPISRGHRGSWQETLRVAEVLERLMLDARYPPVRRLAHGLQFCKLLDACRLGRLGRERLGPLLDMLEGSAIEEGGEPFRNRRPLRATVAVLFRQTVFEYVRLHPRLVTQASWRERMRLIRTALAYARGKGPVPRIHPDFPQATFEALERPLGPLSVEALRPLTTFYEAAAASKHYAVLSRRRWSLTESFRALALTYPVAMWLLRFACGGRSPEVEDVVEVVGAIDRGERYGPLAGRRHRRRVRNISRLGQMPQLLAWYAR